MTRILFTIPNFVTAGSGRAMLNVVERLDRRFYSPAICVSRLGGDLCKEVERLGLELIEAPFTVAPRPLSSLGIRAWLIARVFRPRNFTIWHSYHYSDDYTEPLVARFAGAKAWIYTKKNMNWRRRSWYMRTLLATRVVAQNTTMMREFFSGWMFQRKVALVPSGIDHNLFSPTGPVLGVRGELGLGPDVPIVSVVAHLVPVKGHPIVIEAVSRVPGVHLCLAGMPLDEQYTASLKKYASDLGIADRVHFLGGIMNVPALLRESDVFVLCTVSRGEGCPAALLEAMSSGVACVATNVPGCNDLIQHGTSGVLVRAEDPEALAGALRDVCSSRELRLQLGRNARLRIEGDYTLAREAAQCDSLYRSALGLRA